MEYFKLQTNDADRMNQSVLHGLFILALFFPFWETARNANAETGTVVGVAPSSITVAPGGSFSVDIIIENVVDLWGFDVSVQYDPDNLSVVSANLGDFLGSGLSSLTIDEVAGIVNFVNAQFSGEPKSGDGILFTIEFNAQSIEGLTNLDILEPDGLVLLTTSDGIEIPCSVEHGLVTIQELFYSYLPLVMH